LGGRMRRFANGVRAMCAGIGQGLTLLNYGYKLRLTSARVNSIEGKMDQNVRTGFDALL
jgi:hypothetical protein